MNCDYYCNYCRVINHFFLQLKLFYKRKKRRDFCVFLHYLRFLKSIMINNFIKISENLDPKIIMFELFLRLESTQIFC